MATYTIKHTCGHVVHHNLTGKIDGRTKRADYLTKKICIDCYKAKKTADAKAKNEKNNLPNLTGSPKQIAWAESIRANVAIDANELKGMCDTHIDTMDKTVRTKVLSLINDLMANDSATFWINSRYESLGTENWLKKELSK